MTTWLCKCPAKWMTTDNWLTDRPIDRARLIDRRHNGVWPSGWLNTRPTDSRLCNWLTDQVTQQTTNWLTDSLSHQQLTDWPMLHGPNQRASYWTNLFSYCLTLVWSDHLTDRLTVCLLTYRPTDRLIVYFHGIHLIVFPQRKCSIKAPSLYPTKKTEKEKKKIEVSSHRRNERNDRQHGAAFRTHLIGNKDSTNTLMHVILYWCHF